MTADQDRGGHRMLTAVMLVAAVISGCGSGGGLWEEAVEIYAYNATDLRMAVERNDEELIAETHATIADMLDDALAAYGNAPADLRRLLEQMRDEQRQLAEGQVTGEEAAELRQRHEAYWSDLENGTLPSEFR